MTQKIRTRGMVACAFLIWAAPGATAERGYADAVLGSWDITVEHPEGAYPSWLEIRLRTEGELMARFVGRFGSVRYVSSIRLRENLVEFTAPAQYEAHDLHFVGTLENGEISGKTFDAGGRTVTFTARRAPTLARTSDPEIADSIALFDGTTLDGWRSRFDRHPGCWHVADGLLTATPPCVDLVSTTEFDDFRLEVEFRYPEGSNSGIYLRGRYEVQIQDDHGMAIDPLRMGAIYGFVAPTEAAAKPAGEWQAATIILLGRVVSVVLNGKTIIDGQRIPGITGGALDSEEATPGPIMLQGDHGPIEFRRISLTPL